MLHKGNIQANEDFFSIFFFSLCFCHCGDQNTAASYVLAQGDSSETISCGVDMGQQSFA